MKIKKGQDIDWVRAVRDRFPDVPLMVDANGDYSLSDADHLRQLDEFNLMMVEQPLSYSDIIEHASLQKVMKTAICLDESIHSLADAAAAISIGACRVINVKQGRVGGLLESMRIAHYAAGHGIGGLVRRNGRDRNRAGGEHPPPDRRGLHAARRHVRNVQLLPRGHRRRNPSSSGPDGFIDIPKGPGLGVPIVPELVLKRTIRAERVR